MFINLATQVMIAAWSKSKHYNPHDIDEHMPTLTATDHDELGLIRAIVVKVSCLSTGIVGETIYILIILKERSSPQRKELRLSNTKLVLTPSSFYLTWRFIGARHTLCLNAPSLVVQ